MSEVAKWFDLYLLNSVWQIPVLVLSTAAMLKLLSRAGANLRYRLWVGCLLLSVLLPVISASSSFLRFFSHRSVQPVTARDGGLTPPRNDSGPITMHFTQIAIPDTRRGAGWILPGIYLLSFLIGGAKLAGGLRATRKLVEGSSKISLDDAVQNHLLRSARALRIASVDVYSNIDLVAPATVSWPTPMLIVPRGFTSVPESEVAAAIAHELAHISRKDFEVNLAFEIFALLAFYHPASHWIKRRIAECREMVCDELAADAIGGRNAYARSLLSLAETAFTKPQTASFLLGILETTNLEKRIMKLVDARLPMSWRRKMLLTGCCWTLLTVCSAGLVLFSIHPSAVQAAPALLSSQVESFDVLTPATSRKPAPNFTLTDEQGKAITLSNYKGKVVLLDFWATWCGGCKVEIPWYIQFDKRYKEQGLAVIGVSMDEEGWKAVKPFLAKKVDDETGGMIAMRYPIVIGSDSLAKRYGLTSMPMTLLIDREGRIAVSHTGVVDKADFEHHIQMLLK